MDDDATRHPAAAETTGSESGMAASLVRPVQVIGRVGINLLPFFDEPEPVRPATNPAWVWSLRRFARNAVWLLPAYAVVYAVATFGGGYRTATAGTSINTVRVLGLAVATWLGLLALLALTCLLATARSRGAATAGLLIAVFGALLLPLAEVPGQAHGRTLALVGATVYSVGWAMSGLAVVRSQVFGAFDGVLIMIAAPMLGVGGLMLDVLQPIGALLVLASGIGIAWKASRLLPRANPTLVPPDAPATT